MNKMQAVNITVKNTLKLTVLAAGMLLTSLAAQASTISYDFKSGGTNTSSSAYGNQRTFTGSDATTTVKATAWSLPTLTSDFTAAQLGRASGIGLWACNASEGLNCASPEHQIDNIGGWDFVLLQFSTAVDPATISIATYSQADLDVSFYLGQTASNLSLTGVNLSELAALGFGARLDDDVNSYATSRTVNIVNSAGVTSLLVGARINGDTKADYFKISGMTVNTVGPSEVPEPSTFFLTGAALVGLGLVSRSKKR